MKRKGKATIVMARNTWGKKEIGSKWLVEKVLENFKYHPTYIMKEPLGDVCHEKGISVV